jgi:2,4-dienoyl-CoA reductase-like NADH-dependent reductase (Old Yellow Enzyme family)
MSENMAEKNHIAGTAFQKLYGRWRDGGVGLCISGNVMVDSRYLGEPNNIVIENGRTHFEHLKQWAHVKSGSPMKIWLQLNHPGKQTPKFLCPEPIAPSAIPLRAPLNKMFNTPRAMTEAEILDTIQRYAFAALTARDAGFDGVQIHGAHGYLVSQFLSSHHNQRTDSWGGSLKNRMRFAVEVYQAMRNSVGKDFPIGIKLNSADFQKGGFTHGESIDVAKTLSKLGIDLIEISGGSYENPAMMGINTRDSTKKREAYFLEYARDIKKAIDCPLMVTGGFRTSDFMKSVFQTNELDLIGLARPLAIEPDFPKHLLSGKTVESAVHPLTTGFRFLDKLFPLEITWYTQQLHRMGSGKNPNPNASVALSVLSTIKEIGVQGLRRVRSGE